MNIFIARSAFADLEDIENYYAEQGVPVIGTNFVVAITSHIETLDNHPNIGRIVPEFNKKYIRELIYPPFRIVYLHETGAIHIIRIWRSERLLILPSNE
jgi:toxin ParE1/3/4